MIRLIVGQNATGKTLYLKKKLDDLHAADILTNMQDIHYELVVGYNKKRIKAFRDVMSTTKIVKCEDFLLTSDIDIDCSPKFLRLMDMLCRDKSFVVMDTLDKGLSTDEKMLLVNFLAKTWKTYKEVYMVTNSELMLGLPERKVYTVKLDRLTLDTQLVEVEDGKKYEVID